MYLCICNRVTLEQYQADPDAYVEIMGSQCGKCTIWLNNNRFPGTDEPIRPEWESDNPLNKT